MSRPFVELYIGNQKVEFKEPPQINITYAHTDLHNPSVVKNSFSKTITIDGTPNNNKIFNSIYDLKRVNGDGLYNPSKKVDFTLFRNGEPMETGYVKLDKVKRKGNNVQYDITLYGGLGQFLYNLQYKEDGEKMRLSDLDYGGGENEFDVEINKNTVYNAWGVLNGTTNPNSYPKFTKINFAPCLNGVPKDFGADKVAIDIDSFKTDGSDGIIADFVTGTTTASDVNGFVLGELKKGYDEWQMKDLRSYLQRPVIRFKEIIEACCKPENNGGYTVDLDSDFFSTENPYYEDVWMTLPLLTEMNTESSLDNVEIKDDGTGKFTITGLNTGDKFSTTLKYFLGSNANVTIQSNGYGRYLTTGVYTFDRDTPLISANMAIYSQLVAYDSSGKVIGGSNVVSCTRKNGSIPTNFTYNLEYKSNVTEVYGMFYYEDSDDCRYRFWDDIVAGGWLGGEKPKFELELKDVEYSSGMYLKFVTKTAIIDNGTVRGYGGSLFWTEGYDAFATEPKLLESWSMGEPVMTKKGWLVSKKTLLNSENTPCDYFLSYLKMFNLHIWKDMYDKKIYVKLRKNFFNSSIYDLDKFVDRGSDITITPLTFENKWLVFQNEGVDDQLKTVYLDDYGIDYGVQKIDTNYNFDSSTKNLFEKSVFKSAITTRRKSKYNIDIYIEGGVDMGGNEWYKKYPPFMLDGCQTYLFKSNGETEEGAYLTPKTNEGYDWWSEKYYDFTPKISFVNEKNEPVEGANVLLFYSGKKETTDSKGEKLDLYLSDDVVEFDVINSGEPCWIWSWDWDRVKKVNYLPVFTRYIVNENNWVTHSLDFGTPKTMFVPDYTIDETSDIYSQYWKPYIRDMYDANTRVVECQVLLKERVIGDWLQRFYYFDGSYWVLNKVIDYDVTSNGTTKCEFVRVNDIQNYL